MIFLCSAKCVTLIIKDNMGINKMRICSGISTEWLLSTISRSNWNLEVLVFAEGEKLENPEKTLGARTRTNNKLNPHMLSGNRTRAT